MIPFTRVLALTLLVGSAGCGSAYSPAAPSPTAAPPATPDASSSSVTIPMGAATLGNRAYSPATVTVDAGGTVRWLNSDVVAHTSTADASAWDSGTVAPGQAFATTLATAGTFTYHCAIHPGMVGTIVVR